MEIGTILADSEEEAKEYIAQFMGRSSSIWSVKCRKIRTPICVRFISR
jgi:hypothetical protein